MAKVIMVVGGSRSGKSSYAEQLAGQLAVQEKRQVIYIATATVWDAEFEERIKKHQERRPQAWQTIEEPCDLDRVLRDQADKSGIFLVDGIGTWVANLMYRNNYPDFSWDTAREKICFAKITSFIESWADITGIVIMVADEVGMSIVPENQQARAFRDLNGWTNQYLAKEAGTVYLLTCGIPLQIK